MAADNSGIPIKSSQPFYKKQVKVNVKSLIGNILKAGTNIAFLQWDDLAENGAELLDSLGLETTSGEIAGLLIIRAITIAIQDLTKDNQNLFRDKLDNLRELYKKLENSLDDNEFVIDQDFFEYPQNLPFLKNAQKGFLEWLKALIENPQKAESISRRLPEYFADALFKEWRDNESDYLIIIQELDNPFIKPREKQQNWNHYRAWLQKQIQEPVFWEAFSLEQIYIPLRAYYEGKSTQDSVSDEFIEQRREQINSQSNKRIVINPFDELEKWLTESNPKDAIRLLTGAPGSGKSSFTKVFAAKQAEKGKDVLFIPLHRFNLTGDILESVGEFIEYGGFFADNPLEKNNPELNLLIIFDGLDELSKQGKIAEQVAKEFIEEVRILVNNFNQHKTRLQILISGREVVIQANRSKFTKTYQLLYLLPYFVNDKERKKYNYIDEKSLLKEDQRERWWQKYGNLQGKEYIGLPSELNRDNLIDITSQPLLNYLIVISYEKEQITFNQDTNLNEIYADLLDSVYERGYEENKHRTTEGIEKREFVTILMEIALACWHGNGRTTTVEEIENHCNSGSLKNLLQRFQNSFQENSRASITRLLTAFYFRESGNLRGSEKTFEFSHKSFGEYLTAKRIVLGLGMIDRKLTQSKREYVDDYDEKNALITWTTLCSASPLDIDIFKFICQEIQLQNIETVKQWQQRLCELIEYLMVQGMPKEGINLPTFKLMMEYSKNAESALLIVLNACAKFTKQLSIIKWNSPEAFGEWMARLIGQRKNFTYLLITKCLSYLDLHECNLRLRDFYKANLVRANLVGANLEEANLDGANLEEANLEEANLEEANLDGAILEGAILVEAILVRANLVEANLVEAILEGANLEEANLVRAILMGANLDGAILEGANLKDTILVEANLEEANLEEANLEEANLDGANLDGANLDGANLDGAILKDTILENKYN